MKQFAISVFLLFFRYCLAPHFACPKDRPFLWNTNKCGTFSDICIKYMSDECEFGIRACEQCPLSNFSSTILYQMIRKTYINEDKNCSQTTNERRPTKECSTNGILLTILIIVSLQLIVTTLILLYFICQFIRALRKAGHKPSDIYLSTLEKGIDSVISKSEKKEEKEIDSVISKSEKKEEKGIDSVISKSEKKEEKQRDTKIALLEQILKTEKDPLMERFDDSSENLNDSTSGIFDEIPKKRRDSIISKSEKKEENQRKSISRGLREIADSIHLQASLK